MVNCKTCKHWNEGQGDLTCIGCDGNHYYAAVGKPDPSIKTSLNKQEGGQHYKDKAIQPIVYIHANKLGFCEGNVVKYITRHKEKNGAEDIRKVIHYCELLLELEYKDENLRSM